MFRSYWFKIVAVSGLVLISGLALAEHSPTDLEGDPIASTGQDESTSASDDSGEAEDSNAIDVTPFLKGIESAINDLITSENENERQWQQEREVRDLNAQEGMAVWAKGMFWTAFATTILTLIALAALLRTLHHTKRAANSAEDMAIQAQHTTDAAVKSANAALEAVAAGNRANALAARQFNAGFKPWISVQVKGPFLSVDRESALKPFEDGEESRKVNISANVTIDCVGDMPATIEDFDLRLLAGPEWPYVRKLVAEHRALRPEDIFHIMQSNSTISISPLTGISGPPVPFDTINLTAEYGINFMMTPPPIVGHVVYSDPIGKRYLHKFAVVASPTWGDNFKRYGGRRYNYENEID